MLEVLEFIIKGAGLFLRLMVESGHLLDLSLSGTGRWCIKLFYPPHWNRKVQYPKPIERGVGAMVWSLIAIGIYMLDQSLKSGIV